jgi:hypothetical protein
MHQRLQIQNGVLSAESAAKSAEECVKMVKWGVFVLGEFPHVRRVGAVCTVFYHVRNFCRVIAKSATATASSQILRCESYAQESNRCRSNLGAVADPGQAVCGAVLFSGAFAMVRN